MYYKKKKEMLKYFINLKTLRVDFIQLIIPNLLLTYFIHILQFIQAFLKSKQAAFRHIYIAIFIHKKI